MSTHTMSPMKRAQLLRRRPRKLRSYLIFSALTALFFAGYLVFLDYQNRQMAAYYGSLRHEHPNAYLAKLAELKGFHAYLDELERMGSYSELRAEVPPFLVGRWRLFKAPKNVTERYFPDSCLSGVQIEDGRVRMFGLFEGDYQARYRMQGVNVDASLDRGRQQMPIRLVSYGSHLHHIEVTVPGSADVYYGYLCK
ncbi:MAG TPA: hypothetical protein VE631_12405 [Alphaproteobacteria bacterium]|nr:hypothetical protein [Alphaproteobacteria bacterium]